MPGPGGGSRGGGGHGGGFGGHGGGGFGGHGGGFGGHGGFHGGFHHRPHYRPWGFRRGYYGGFGGGCLGILLVPIVLVLFAVLIFFSTVASAFGSIGQGGVIQYDEKAFQDYTNTEYSKAFATSTAFEDNVLIVVLTNEDADEYYYIAWVGDHIATDINYMFGNETTELGRAMQASINTSGYWYSLDSNLAGMVTLMGNYIGSREESDTFTCNDENHIQVDSKLVNYTDAPMTEATVNDALAAFTEKTGIPMVIVVEDMTDVFETGYGNMIFGIIIILVLLAIAVAFVYKAFKGRKKENNNY